MTHLPLPLQTIKLLPIPFSSTLSPCFKISQQNTYRVQIFGKILQNFDNLETTQKFDFFSLSIQQLS